MSGTRVAPDDGPSRRPGNCFTCQSRSRSEWCSLDREDLALLNRAKVDTLFSPGQIVFHQGSPCEGVYCVEQGTIGLRRRAQDGQSVITHLFHPGNTMGYVSYFSGRPHSGTAEALTDARVCFIRREALNSLLQRNPALGYRFMGTLASRLGDAEEEKVEALLHPLRARIAHLLLTLKDRFGRVDETGALSIELPISRQDIAALVGARPESVSRAIKHLEDGDVAHFRGRVVVVPDLDPLMDAAELLDEA
ncbi:MAG: Crp/Fnr family transcriptional regulator [Acidobacteriota bacterium]|nr:Crp/Fnr family transcriptional regulator [Acidobacteriota bacterium]